MQQADRNSPSTDIVFITYVHPPNLQDDPEIYTATRLMMEGIPASIPILKSAAAGRSSRAELLLAAEEEMTVGMPPVLTPILLQEAMARRGVVLRDITYIDAEIEKLKSYIETGIGLFALSTTWCSGMAAAVAVRDCARRLKALAPHIPIVAGGISVKKAMKTKELIDTGYFAPEEIPRLKNEYLLLDAEMDADIDAVVVTDAAENVLSEIALRIRRNEDFRSLPGLALPEATGYRFTPPLEAEPDLDSELVDWRNQVDRLEFHAAPIRTASGCPFKCGFCDFSTLFKVRSRSVDSLLRELRTLAAAKPAPRQVFFADDNVALNKKRLKKLTRAIIDENMQLSWRAFIRADSIDAETAALMRESGCMECFMGVESGDPRILKAMNKKLDPERALSAAEQLDAMGINTLSTFVVGFPGETAESIERTAAFISSLPKGDGANAIHRYQLFRFYLVSLCPVAGPESRARFDLHGIGDNWYHSTMSAEEAKEAMREIFLKVSGTPLMYLETLPTDWTTSNIRRVMTLRDEIVRSRMQGRPADIGSLLAVVRAAEQ